MRYLVFLSLTALYLFAATAEDVYHIYKAKGIGAVEEYLKREFEPKISKEPIKKEVVTKEVAVKDIMKEPRTKIALPRASNEKDFRSKDFWMKHIKDIDVQLGYYQDVESLVVCEKEKKRCDIYRNSKDGLKFVKSHDVIMGKSGDKVKRGDLKTPVGVYDVTKRFKPTDQFYGPLAFSLSYPNMYDMVRGKTGDGIWIHGSPLDGKYRDDLSKGCVVFDNGDIQVLDTQINSQSAITIIGENKVPKISKETIASILSEVYKWQHAWKVNDINTYLNFYANEFKKSDGSGIKAFSQAKQSIFARKESKTIIFENISIAPYPTPDDKKLFKISFHQTYKSPSFASKGEKELYVELIGDKISILAEK